MRGEDDFQLWHSRMITTAMSIDDFHEPDQTQSMKYDMVSCQLKDGYYLPEGENMTPYLECLTNITILVPTTGTA